MEPITAGLAVFGVAGSLAAQWIASEEAKSIDKKRRDEIAGAIAAFEQNYKMPDLDPTPITLEQYTLLKQFAPKIAAYVQEKMPDVVTEARSQDVIQVQKDAMKQMMDLAKAGSGDAQYQAQRAEGEVSAQNARKRQQQDMLRQYASQGLAGGSQELLAGVANNQASEQSQRVTNLQAAAQNDSRRLDALRGAANQANSIRGDNYRTEAANTSVINSFNQRNASNQNNYNQYATGLQNDAEKYNINAAQSIANSNVGIRNENKVNIQQRADMIERTNRMANNERAGRRLDAATGRASVEREDSQADLGRKVGMANTVISGATSVASAYANQPKAPIQGSSTGSTGVLRDMPAYDPDPNAEERAKRLQSGDWFSK